MTQRVLVTGAASGIGAAVSSSFAATGAEVVGWDLTPAPGLLQVDVTDAEAIRKALATDDEFDAVVHAAGVGFRESIAEAELATWKSVLDVNLTSTFVLAQATHPALAKRSGVFVAIGSVAGSNWFVNRSAYCASKAALRALIGCAAIEWAGAGVRAVLVSPSFVDSPMAQQGIAEGLTSIDDIMRHTPQRRLISPEEVGAAVVALTSPAFASLTGSEVFLDGGFTALGGF